MAPRQNNAGLKGVDMLQRFKILANHTTLDARLERYVKQKIGGLDRYMPRRNRDSIHAEIRLAEAKAKDRSQQAICDVTLHLPKETIKVTNKATTVYAAVDLVEDKLKQQIKKYKDLHTNAKLRRRLAARGSRRTASFDLP